MSIALLPREVLSLIFASICPKVFPYESPPLDQALQEPYPLLNLAHVSSYWRHVIWSTPELWSCLLLIIQEKKRHGIIPVLELYLQNAQERPFSLDLTFYFETRLPSILHHVVDSIKHLLFGDSNTHSRKIQALRLVDAPTDWLPAISTNCPLLRHLSIFQEDMECLEDIKLTLGNLTHLCQFVLVNIYGTLVLPWLFITQLELSCIPIVTCVKCLTQSLNLVKFSCLSPASIDALVQVPYPSNFVVTLHYLQDFTWTTLHHQLHVYLVTFQQLRLPALLKLTWIGEWGNQEVGGETRALFSNLPDLLEVLRLEYIHTWTPDLIKLVLRPSRSIRELTVVVGKSETIKKVFELLFPGKGHDGLVFPPTLVSLKIEDLSATHSRDVFNATFSEELVLLCKRLPVKLGFRLYIEFPNRPVLWAPGIREELCAMVKDGFSLEVVDEGGKVVPWP